MTPCSKEDVSKLRAEVEGGGVGVCRGGIATAAMALLASH